MPAARVVAGGAVLTGAIAYWVATGDQTVRIASHLAVYGTAFAAYLVALSGADALSRRGVGLALVAALLWRLALVPVPPLVSDDVYRYVWEGRIQLHGGNPYAPEDRAAGPRFEALRDDVWAKMNHKELTAVYPPFWQLLARGIVAVHDSVAAMKAFAVACEAATAAWLAMLLRRRGQPSGRLLIFAWSPLSLVEVAGGAHNEAAGVLLLVGALAALEAGRAAPAALAFALGFAAKLLPAFVALACVRRFRPWHALLSAAAVALMAWPYLDAGTGLVHSLRHYAAYWRFNESLFALWALLLPDQVWATRVSALLLLGAAGLLAWRRTPPVTAALLVVQAALLVSANVLPWYALWLLPLLVLEDNPAALLFTGTVALAYLVYPIWHSGERWHVGWDVRALEYGPCGVLAAWAWWRGRRAAPIP